MTSPPPDLYAILGLPARAPQDEIGHAYRLLLRQHHPDTRAPCPDHTHEAASDATLQQVLAAHAVLSDPARRADYDRHTAPRPRDQDYQAGTVGPPFSQLRQPQIWASPVRWHH